MKIIIIPNAPRMTARHYCLAKALVEAGHSVDYVMWELPYTLPTKEMFKHIFTALKTRTYAYESFTMHKFRRLPFFWPFINGQLFKKQLRSLYHSIKADIIFGESYTNETEVPKELPLIYDLADDYAGPADVFGSKMYKIAFKLLDVRGVMQRQCQNAVAVTVVSKILFNYASKYNNTVLRLPNGINTTIVRNAIEQRKPTANKYSLVYASGFGRWSRIIEVMKTVTVLRKEFPLLQLTLLGDGTEVENIKKYITTKNAASYIHYLGFISDQEKLFKLINQNVIGINISEKNAWRDASQPMKLMDYTALGLTVLSTDLEEVKQLAFPNTLIFSNEGTGFIDAARKALVMPQKSKANEALSRKILAEYDWSLLAKQLTELMQSKLNKRNYEEAVS